MFRVFFFFSSRRRHTRSLCDWSSDVCSSDLWAIKYSLLERYRAKRDLPLSHPRIAQMDLAYHDISRRRGLYYLLERAGQVERVAHEPRIFEAKNVPPQTTRARLRGEFIRKAQEKRRDFTVDWVHLKLNDQ